MDGHRLYFIVYPLVCIIVYHSSVVFGIHLYLVGGGLKTEAAVTSKREWSRGHMCDYATPTRAYWNFDGSALLISTSISTTYFKLSYRQINAYEQCPISPLNRYTRPQRFPLARLTTIGCESAVHDLRRIVRRTRIDFLRALLLFTCGCFSSLGHAAQSSGCIVGSASGNILLKNRSVQAAGNRLLRDNLG